MKGYFYHLHPDFIPTDYDFCFVRAVIGTSVDPSFYENWNKVNHIRRGIYQNPFVTPENDAYQHASWLVDTINNIQGDLWKVMPIVINATALHVDLMFLDTWLSRINEQLPQPFPKPLVYISPKVWSTIIDVPDGQLFVARILQKAGIFWSEWNVSTPRLAQYCTKQDVQYWEYTKGVIQNSATGVFTAQPTILTPTPTQTNHPTSTKTISNITGSVNIHLACPYCGKKIF